MPHTNSLESEVDSIPCPEREIPERGLLFSMGIRVQEESTKTLILSLFDYGVVLVLGLALFSFATGRNVRQWMRSQTMAHASTNPAFNELSDLPPIPPGSLFAAPNPLASMAPSKMTLEERYFWNPRLRYSSEGELARTKRTPKKAASTVHRAPASSTLTAAAKPVRKNNKRKNWRSDPINMVY
jgi:hypothetical protein